MRHVAIVSIALALLVVATATGSAPAPRLLCAVVDVYDCSAGECVEVESEVVGVPDLVRLDGGEKTMTALDAEFAGGATTLESMTNEGGKTAARAREGDRSLVLQVEDESGDAMITVSDHNLVLVAYGECSRQ
jgi:hypothetical protein